MRIVKVIRGVLLLLIAGATIPMFSQTVSTSQVSGVVQDPTGAYVPGAQVQLTRTETGQVRRTTTSASGAYLFTDLPGGAYAMQVSASGFSLYSQRGLVLEVGNSPTINVKLSVGAVTQEVVVEASGATVETVSSGVGQVINRTQVVDLPLNGRDPTQLIALAGITTPAPSGDLNSNKNFPTITLSVAGGLPNGISYLLDGGSHNNPFNNLNMALPFPDALQEFKSETSSLPAQFGNHASAAINVVTKSGGNRFHGDLFEFVRNYAFNAANFFGYNTTTGAKVRDNLKRNQFGGVIGGPIIKDKLFFFVGYQGTITRSSKPPVNVFVPTQDMMNGDFTTIAQSKANGGCQSKPVTLGAPFVNNKINPSLFNQQALNAIKAGLPIETNPCGTHNVVLSQNSTQQQTIGRIDYTRSDRQSLFARYFIARYNQPVIPGNILEANETAQINQDQSITIGDTYSFTPRLVNSARITGNRSLNLRQIPAFFDPDSLGIDSYTTPQLKGFMGVSVTNGFSIGQGGNNPGYFNSTDYEFIDDVSYSLGSHQISAGVDYLFAMMNTVNNRPTNGAYTFNGSITGGSVLGYADFLTGNVSALLQGNADYENDAWHYFGAYVQDAWKIKHRVTLNYGLRWEPYIPFFNVNSHAQYFSADGFSAGKISSVYTQAPAGLTFPGDPGFSGRSYNFGKKAIFEPRIGVIYDPTGSGRMTIRAGYGIFYDTPQMFFDTRYSNSPPWGQSISLSGPLSFTHPWATYPGGDPFPALSKLTPTTPFVQAGVYVNTPPHIQPMYLQQWNLSVQKQAGNWLFAGTYIGNTTTHLPTSFEANPAIYDGIATIKNPNTNNRRKLYLENPAQGVYYSTIGQYDDGGSANYNGMLLSVQHHTNLINLLANYTFSHCLSEASTTELTGPSYVIPGNRQASYANCPSDIRQVANISLILHTPKFANRLTNLSIGGWGLSTILTTKTGGYGTVTTGADDALSGIGGQLATTVSNPYTKSTRFGAANNLTTAAFAIPALGTYSLQRPLTILGPGSYELDMALLRSFKVTEDQSFQFRWEVFNAPNAVAFTGSAATTVTSSTFGQFTTAADPRIMQLALKYIF